jgi:tRNA1Val (adenine37-N6)-methyltransferase
LSVFRFKQFDVKQEHNSLKVGTDSMLLGAFIDAREKLFGLDLGAGTGVLSLMVAQKNPEIQIDAVEINNEALKECDYNFQNSSWKNRLISIEGDYLKLNFERKYDLIFSNPPYHLEDVLGDNLDATRAKHSSSNELKELIDLASNIISNSGDFWLILPYQLADFVIEIANKSHFHCHQIIRIHSKESKRNTRIIIRFSKKKEQLFERDFFIRNEDNSYTSDYIELTKDFHFKKLSD